VEFFTSVNQSGGSTRRHADLIGFQGRAQGREESRHGLADLLADELSEQVVEGFLGRAGQLLPVGGEHEQRRAAVGRVGLPGDPAALLDAVDALAGRPDADGEGGGT
jgi:hypothetical protein